MRRNWFPRETCGFHLLTQQGVDLLEVSLVLLLLTESQEAEKWRQTERRHSPAPTKYKEKQIKNLIYNMRVCKILHNKVKS